MKLHDPAGWIWSDALELLERADRIHRQFFQLRAQCRGGPVWEPPVDIYETGQELVVLAALPGVRPDQLYIGLEGTALVVRGQRALPDLGLEAEVRRIEIPYGCFERRIELPARPVKLGQRTLSDGCLTLVLHKSRATP